MTYLYVAACIVVPLVWGITTVLVTRWLEARSPKPQASPARERLSDIDYYI
jgi:hypothetical protein